MFHRMLFPVAGRVFLQPILTPQAHFVLPGLMFRLPEFVRIFDIRRDGKLRGLIIKDHTLIDQLLVFCSEIDEWPAVFVLFYHVGFHEHGPIGMVQDVDQSFFGLSAPGTLPISGESIPMRQVFNLFIRVTVSPSCNLNACASRSENLAKACSG